MLDINRLYVRGTLEYHRNTLIEKPQNNGLIGAGIEWYLRPTANQVNVILNSDLKYARDVIDNKGSFVWTAELAPYSPTFNRPINRVNKSVRWFLSPSGGFEYQSTFDAPSDTRDSLRGQVLRALVKGKILLKFLDVFAGRLVGKPVFEVYAD